jgi:drug/metabolite transporter (DMT)-like permease
MASIRLFLAAASFVFVQAGPLHKKHRHLSADEHQDEKERNATEKYHDVKTGEDALSAAKENMKTAHVHRVHVNQVHTARSKLQKTDEAEGTATQSASAPSDSMILTYSGAVLVMVIVVSAMFFQMGFAVVVQVVMYVCCLAFVKIVMKVVYEYGFDYAKFVTSLHLFVSSLAAFAVLFFRQQTSGKPIAVPTANELCFGILPISMTFGLSIGTENQALVLVSAAFSEVVAASNPVMSAFLTWLFGMGFDMRLLAPICVVVSGCVLSVKGELHFSSMGLFMLLFAVFLRGIKAVMQQKLMTGETKEKFDPVTLMAWSCMLACLQLVIYSAATEGRAPFDALAASTDATGLISAIIASCIIACALNMSALYVVKQLGAVGMQMVSQMKSLLVVIGGIALLSESFTPLQYVGFGIVLIGVYWFSYMKRTLTPPPKA